MATFLTLVNLALDSINETELNNTNFSSAMGPQKGMINGINAAIADISRREQQWPFNYTQQTFTTTLGEQEYTPSSAITTIKWNTFGIEQNNAVTPPIVASTLSELDYNQWAKSRRPQDQQAASSTWTVPEYVIKGDDGNIILSGPPGQNSDPAKTNYTVYFDAWANPAALVNWNDTCLIPDVFNYIIVDGAKWYAYDFRSDQAAQDRTKAKFDAGIAEMQRQLIKPTDSFKSTMVINTRSYNSIPSRYGL